MAELRFEQGEALDQLSDRWQEVVGDRAARHSYPTALRGPVLEVTTESSAWCQQLQYRSEEILLTSHHILGNLAPRELRFLVG
jgi:predicted nucleic acid-binding Zn ribbon protein